MKLERFDGGWNADADRGQLAANELARADNCVLSARGGLEKRPGTRRVVTGAKTVQQIEWIRNDGSVLDLAVTEVGGVYTLCRVEEGAFVPIQAVAGRVGYFPFQNRLFFVDGGDYRYYDHDTGVCAAVQLPPAPIAPTLTGAGNGDWSGSYLGKVTFVDQYGVESAASPASAECVIDKVAQINWTVPVGPEGTVSRRLYRTVNGGMQFRHVVTMGNNTITDFIDTVRDDLLGDELPEDMDLTPVKKCRYCIRHNKSMRFIFGGDGSPAVYYTEPNGPAARRITSVLYPKAAVGSVIGITEFSDAFIVWYQHGAAVFRGVDPNYDAVWESLTTKQVPANSATVELCSNGLMYHGGGGIMAINPALIGIPNAISPGDNLVANVAAGKVARVVEAIPEPEQTAAAFDTKRKRYYFAYQDQDGHRLMVLDEDLRSFVRWLGFNIYDVLYKADKQVWFGTDNGIVALDPESLHDYDEAGQPVPVVFDIQTDHMSQPETQMLFNRAYVVYENPGLPGYRLDVYVYVDGVEVLHEQIEPPADVAEKVTAAVPEDGTLYRRGKEISIRVVNDQLDMPARVYAVAIEAEPVETFGGQF